MRSILLYNLYPKSNWRELTTCLLQDVPHETIAINVTLDWKDQLFQKRKIFSFLKGIPKVKYILSSRNDKRLGEVIGFDNLRLVTTSGEYDVVTYLHSKGVTKPHNQCIQDWVELMRYFQVDRFDLCLQAFEQGYGLYGVNLGKYEGEERQYVYKLSDFHYSGNFVSVNMNLLREAFLTTPCDRDYFGVEAFWGKLCPYEKAYCPHVSSPTIQNHYTERYPIDFYKK